MKNKTFYYKNEELAKEFIQAIKTLAENEDNLQNFEDYLIQHFDIWFKSSQTLLRV